MLISGGDAWLRTGPGTAYDKAGVAKSGDKLAYANEDNWVPVLVEGRLLWVSREVREGGGITMSETIVVALITGGLSLLGSIIAQRRQTSLTIYRIDELEGKVSKHNNLIERTYKLEGRVLEAEHDIRDLKNRRDAQ